MEMILTGRLMSAKEAQLYGLVAGVYPSADLVDEALKMSEEISAFSRPVASLAKETVNSTEELSLREGLKLERRLFHSLFALDDQKKGMKAFIEKRPAEFT